MLEFFKNKNIFITGHTGFKGTWLCKILINAGANVTGYALAPPTEPNLFDISGVKISMNSVIGDIRDLKRLEDVFVVAQPEIVIHLAAQPLVRTSYHDPHDTFETNIMGTVNVLECIRKSNCVKSFLNVTTDKVYQNNEWSWGYRENDPLGGADPYSNSKSCSELVTESYKKSFFTDRNIAISTARAGNVIGGGDFAKDRIIPDCIKASEKKEKILVRNPNSTRPFQHVIEPLYAYLLIIQKQFEDATYAGCYNVGPQDSDCITTGELVTLFCEKWYSIFAERVTWITERKVGPHEANYLKLDCSKLRNDLGWKPKWNIETAMEKTIEWTKAFGDLADMSKTMDLQIHDFLIRN